MFSKILIIDDHPLILSGLGTLLRSRFPDHIVISCNSLGMAESMLASQSFDLSIMDINFPDGVIFDMLSRTANLQNLGRAVFFSAHLSNHSIDWAQSFNARGMISKNENPEFVIQGILKVISGEVVYSNCVSDKLLARRTQQETSCWKTLTNREFSVMKLLAAGKTAKIIANDLSISPKTVDRHRCNLMEKMRMRSQLELSHFAIKEGLILL